MISKEFVRIRKILGKTQKQLAELLGTSLKAIHSYEQGWRNVPWYVERQLLFVLSRKNGRRDPAEACWEIKNCSEEQRAKCPAWEFNTGDLCWFINGTICAGLPQKNWQEKMEICRHCEAFRVE
ncbi:MAG: transcriptional regulator [bacterium]|nr:transcriptional regulator [bacterium]